MASISAPVRSPASAGAPVLAADSWSLFSCLILTSDLAIMLGASAEGISRVPLWPVVSDV